MSTSPSPSPSPSSLDTQRSSHLSSAAPDNSDEGNYYNDGDGNEYEDGNGNESEENENDKTGVDNEIQDDKSARKRRVGDKGLMVSVAVCMLEHLR